MIQTIWNKVRHRTRFAAFLVCVLVIGLPMSASAQAIPKSCSSEIYDVMKAKSYLQGQRESELAARIILKPDSVLEYSCFDAVINNQWIPRAGSFSDKNPLGTGHFDGSVRNVIETSYTSYIDNNFDHDYLGGSLTSAVSSGGFCDIQRSVWHLAKCTNADIGQFFALDELIDNDLRTVPESCDDTSARDSKVQAAIDLLDAFPDGQASPPFGIDNASLFNGGPQTYTERLQACGDPVPTGREVEFISGDSRVTIDDFTCVTPGCTYTGSGGCTRGTPGTL